MKCSTCSTENPSDSKYCKGCAAPLSSSEDIQISQTKTLEIPKEELSPGSYFADRYQIIEELGKGGMGRVYKALDKELNEEVAIKLIRSEIASDKIAVERFRNELKVARKIIHKNVGRVFEIMDFQGTSFITMEYVRGENLAELMCKVGKFSVSQAISLAKQVCEGLDEAHKLGIIHRDLKPSNIMIDKDGNARIMDFGLARSKDQTGITSRGKLVGTPAYRSLEQAEGKEVDHRSDIYSLGVILFEMMTGQLPFEADTPVGIALKQKLESPEDPKELSPQIPEGLSKVILKCLDQAKEKRFRDVKELLSEIGKIEKGLPASERRVSKIKPLTSKEISVKFSLKKLFVVSMVVISIFASVAIVKHLNSPKDGMFPPKIENSIAVISFENQTGDKSYDYLQRAIPNLFITTLEQSGDLNVATWERMRDLLKQIGKGNVGNIDPDLGFKLCRMEGIAAIVLGSFIKAGDTFAMDVKVLDVETKRLIKSAKAKGKGEESILDTQIDDLSVEILQGIGLGRGSGDTSQFKVSEVTTSSIEAYNYFLKGVEAAEKLYFDDARQFLEKAIDLDSTFALAYFYLSRTYFWLEDPSAREKALTRAKSYSKKSSEKERLYIEAAFADVIEKNSKKAHQILSELVKKYPREKRAHLDLGAYYHSKKMFNKAIAEVETALELDPNNGQALNDLAYIYSAVRNYTKALEYLKKYASIYPGDANPLDSMGETYLRMGRLDEAIAKFKETLEIKPDFLVSRMNIGYALALKENYSEALKWIDQKINLDPSPGIKSIAWFNKGFYHFWLGGFKESLDAFEKASSSADTIKNEWFKAWIEYIVGFVYYEKGDLELSRKSFASWFDFIMEYQPKSNAAHTAFQSFNLGLLDLKQARIDTAKSKLAEMKSLLPEIGPPNEEQAKFFYEIFLGEVLLAEGSFAKAISVLEKSPQLAMPSFLQSILFYNVPPLKDVLARAYLKNGELEKAVSEYERLITFDPKTEGRFLIHPKYYYRLAKLYEQKGWKGKAINQYEKFLDLWKDADQGLTEVEDAEKRLAVLDESP